MQSGVWPAHPGVAPALRCSRIFQMRSASVLVAPTAEPTWTTQSLALPVWAHPPIWDIDFAGLMKPGLLMR
jgi:hypothetical protein